MAGDSGQAALTWAARGHEPTWASKITHERADAADGIMHGREWTWMDRMVHSGNGERRDGEKCGQQNLTLVRPSRRGADGRRGMHRRGMHRDRTERNRNWNESCRAHHWQHRGSSAGTQTVTRARQKSACCSYDVLPTLLKSCTVPLRARMRCCAVVDHRGSAASADKSATTASTLSTPPHPARCCSAPSG